MWDPHCGYILPLFLPCLMLSLLRGSCGGHVGGSYCITITGSRMGYYARAGTHITYFLLEFFPLTILSRTEIVLKRFSTWYGWFLPVLFVLWNFQLLLIVIISYLFASSVRSWGATIDPAVAPSLATLAALNFSPVRHFTHSVGQLWGSQAY